MRINLLGRSTPVFENMLFICERILWSVSRTILLPHRMAFAQQQRHTTLGAFQSVLHSALLRLEAGAAGISDEHNCGNLLERVAKRNCGSGKCAVASASPLAVKSGPGSQWGLPSPRDSHGGLIGHQLASASRGLEWVGR